jgi:hypothetical protein
MRSRNRAGMDGSSTTRGELCARYVTSPFAAMLSSTVSVAVYVLCCGSEASAASTAASALSFIGTGAGGGLNGWYLLRM